MTATQDQRLAAIAAAGAALRRSPTTRSAPGTRRPRRGCQADGSFCGTAVQRARNRRVLVARPPRTPGGTSPPRGLVLSRARPVGDGGPVGRGSALGVIVGFHGPSSRDDPGRHGFGDIRRQKSGARRRERRHDATLAGQRAGPVAAAAWRGGCDVFTDFLAPALRDRAEAVTYLAEADAIDSAGRPSDIAFRTGLADREGPVELVARGLAALWFERDLTRLAGTLPRDLESSETALAAVAPAAHRPRAKANANSVVVRVLLEAGTLHERCVREKLAAPYRSGRIWRARGPRRRARRPGGTTCSGSATPRAISGWPRPGTAVPGGGQGRVAAVPPGGRAGPQP